MKIRETKSLSRDNGEKKITLVNMSLLSKNHNLLIFAIKTIKAVNQQRQD